MASERSEVELSASADAKELQEYADAVERVADAHDRLRASGGTFPTPGGMRVEEGGYVRTSDGNVRWNPGEMRMPPPLPRPPESFRVVIDEPNTESDTDSNAPKITRYTSEETDIAPKHIRVPSDGNGRYRPAPLRPPLAPSPDEEDEEDFQPRSYSRKKSAALLGYFAATAPIAIATRHVFARGSGVLGAAGIAAGAGADLFRYTRDMGRRGFSEWRNAYAGEGSIAERIGENYAEQIDQAKEYSHWRRGLVTEEAKRFNAPAEEDDIPDEERRHREMLKALKGASGRGYSMAKGVAAGAIGYGIGSSVMGFFSGASQEYIQHAQTMRQLKQVYREFGKEVRGVGYQMGYTIEQTAAATRAIGEQINTVDKSTLTRYTGFGRQYGLDDAQVAGTVGRLQRLDPKMVQANLSQRLQARAILGLTRKQALAQSSDVKMAFLHASAERSGMGQGRFGEYLQTYTQMAEEQFRNTGHVDSGTDFAMRFPELLFGEGSPRAQGSERVRTSRAAGQLFSGSSSSAMRLFMMRASGYGEEGGPSFMDMEERFDAGINDPRNAAAFFKRLQGVTSGMSAKDQQYTAYMMLRSDAKKAGFNVSGLRRFIQYGTSEEGLRELQGMAEDPEKAGMADLDVERFNKEEFAKGGFSSVGRKLTTLAERRNVQLEAMKNEVGASVTKSFLNLGEVAKSLASSLENILGLKLTKAVEELTEKTKQYADQVDAYTNNLPGAVEGYRLMQGMSAGEATYEAAGGAARWTNEVLTPVDEALPPMTVGGVIQELIMTAGSGGGKK